MNRSPVARALLASAALFAAAALSGCETDNLDPALSAKANKSISPNTLAVMAKKNMAKETPILIRLFKQESELEVWKKDGSGQFALLHTYPICRWSGDLGPKIREGDRQAPEGFYTITPGLMNPASQYHLAFNLGFPNAFDRAHGRTGAHLMVHGDCSSRGCYAMTDEQVSEIYALARESFFGGQRSFQVQAYPFRMTPANMARHRNNPHMAFWRMLKEGYDNFEVTRQEPKVDVCEKRYVFNAQSTEGFNPAGQCPAYEVPQEIAQAVAEKKQRDDTQIATLIRRTPAAPVKMATDGGMHEVFAQVLQGGREVKGQDGAVERVAVQAPGTIPDHVNPPSNVIVAAKAPAATPVQETPAATQAATRSRTNSLVARATSQNSTRPAQAAAVQPTRTASADPSATSSLPERTRDFLKNLFTKDETKTASAEPSAAPAKPTGLRGVLSGSRSNSKPAAPAQPASPPAVAKPQQPATPAPTAVAEAKPRPLPEAEEAAGAKMANAGAIKPSAPALGYNAWLDGKPLSGAAPMLPSGSFGTGWSGVR